MKQLMTAYFLDDALTLIKREVPLPDIPNGWVLIKVHSVGICGSDIEYYLHNQCGSFVPRRPFVLGHEFSGEIVQVGEGVQDTLIGARVTVDPSIPCRHCHYCVDGRYNLCSNLRVIGSAASYPHLNGGFGQYVIVPAENCYEFSEYLTFAEAALTEPLSVAVHAALRPRTVSGKNILITGAGTIGQLLNLVLRHFGAGQITVSDVKASRRQLALENGADYSIDPRDKTVDDLLSQITDDGFDLIFESSGAVSALNDGLKMIRKGGTIVQIGTLPEQVTLPLNQVMGKELMILGSLRAANVFDIALSLLQKQQFNARSIISEVYSFDQTPEAFAKAAERGDSLKIQVDVQGDDSPVEIR